MNYRGEREKVPLIANQWVFFLTICTVLVLLLVASQSPHISLTNTAATTALLVGVAGLTTFFYNWTERRKKKAVGKCLSIIEKYSLALSARQVASFSQETWEIEVYRTFIYLLQDMGSYLVPKNLALAYDEDYRDLITCLSERTIEEVEEKLLVSVEPSYSREDWGPREIQTSSPV